ncbi:hypothetical protein MAM1_0016c01508 [Mucor ambiguus]|uniref:RING-type domain-containing protein n=1 Tax=Mucor ambiguus TaxID=91626 RepID=A0A0C9MJL0_9FUNG|nr:hypothetical protein MAM1_0016c01508 [Mucor ambiguus]
MNGLDIICIICQAELALSDMPMQVLDCGHVFHKDCVEAWLNISLNKCPICKKICSKGGKQPIYLSSQPAFNNLRVEVSDAIKKTHEELEKSMEERFRLFEDSLLKEFRKIHKDFTQERRQAEKTKQDWLHSYTQLQTIVVVLAAYVVFKACIETPFGALLVFFVLVEGTLLSTERNFQRLKDVVNKLEL